MKRQDFTIHLILFSFFLKQFARNLIYPNLIVISRDFFGEGTFKVFEMGLLITALMGGSAVACLLFGILADKFSRKIMAIISTMFWIFGLILSAYGINYYILLLGFLLLGFGSGGFIPVAQTIIADGTPPNKRGYYYGLSSIFMLLGMICGLLVASIFSPFWQTPYFIAAFLTIITLIFYCIFGKNYQVGFSEEVIQNKTDNDENFVYNYHITWKTFKNLFRNKTNVLVFIEGIFSVIGFTIIVFCLYPFLIDGPAHISPLIVSLIYILFITPFQVLSIFFWGKMGDKFEKKNNKIRIWFIVISITITTPYFILVFWIQGAPAKSTDSLEAALMNPGILTFIILFALGSFLLGTYDSNQPPIINAINLPETRGSVYALNRFVEELGGAIGPLLLGIIFESVNHHFSTAITIGMLFFIPGTICWWIVLKTFSRDREEMLKILKEHS